MNSSPDWYAVLGVSPESEDVVIQAAYRALMRRYHPDSNKSPEAASKAQQINAAYAVLGSSKNRAAYDISRRRKEGARRDEPSSGSEKEQEPCGSRATGTEGSSQTPTVSVGSGRGGLAFVFYALLLLGSGVVFAVASDGSRAPSMTSSDDGSSGVLQTEPTGETGWEDLSFVAHANTIDDSALNRSVSEDSPRNLSEQVSSPLNYNSIDASADRLSTVLLKSGVIGAREFSETCHEKVRINPTWDAADRCAAFDYAAAYVDEEFSRAARVPANGYFRFQRDNQDDHYEAIGAPVYSVSLRLMQLRKAAEPAAAESLQIALAAGREAERPTKVTEAIGPTSGLNNEMSASTEKAADENVRSD